MKLNNVKLNYFVLVSLVMLTTFIYNKFINYSLNTYLYFFFKKTKFFFIKKFYLGFFKIHPIVFYFTLIYYLISFYKNIIYCKLKYNYLLYIGIFSFVLGGYWNMFHLQSGRFWSNDSIEILLVFLIYVYIRTIHKIENQIKLKYLNFFRFLIILMFIRFNFIYTKHNFFNLTKKNLKILIYTNIIALISLVTWQKQLKKKLFLQNKILNLSLLLYGIFIVLFNYVNFLKLKIYHKFIILIIIFYTMSHLDWTYLKNKPMHIVMFSVIIIYFIFSTKYIYSLQIRVVSKQILLIKKLNNYVNMVFIGNHNLLNLKNYKFYFNYENNILNLLKIKILVN